MESSKNSLDNSCSILCCISAFFAGEAFRHFSAVSSNLYFNTFHSIIICDMYKDTKKKKRQNCCHSSMINLVNFRCQKFRHLLSIIWTYQIALRSIKNPNTLNINHLYLWHRNRWNILRTRRYFRIIVFRNLFQSCWSIILKIWILKYDHYQDPTGIYPPDIP